MTTTLPKGHRLIRIGDLTERHHGRRIQVAGLEGTLVGSIGLGSNVALTPTVGGAHVWTDWLDGDETAEVWREVSA